MAGEYLVLGPVRALGPGGAAAVQGARQRAIIGVLALHAGTVVSVNQLIEALWGDHPPRTAARTLHSHIARIRQALAAVDVPPALVTSAPGYLLDVAPEHVDAHRFEHAVRDAARSLASGDLARAASVALDAAALWHGDAFADTPLSGWARHEVDTLHERRLTALETGWEARIRLGDHDDAAGELPRLIAAHPGREQLAALAMRALYRSGRHADALEQFQRLREHLADELGADPGPDLVALHTAILRHDPALTAPPEPPSAPVPAQLPAGVGHFAGRSADLALLDAATGGVVVVSGAPGLGKTALALEWAHRATSRFPDGQLFVDLHGHDPVRAVSAADALAHLLRGLDIPDDRMPGTEAERAALYRSLVHGRRLLVLADNAASSAQVLPLVPGTGPATLVVTSRASLSALGTRHAVAPVPLAALDHDESLALLRQVLGPALTRATPEDTNALVDLCQGVPLALRLAAARVSETGIADLVATSRGAGARAVLGGVYQPLPDQAARMFRLLGTSPGATVSNALGAVLCDLSPADAQATMDRLAAAQLVTPVDEGRFRFHDLVREYARQRAELDETPAGLHATGTRLVDWYLWVAGSANAVIDPDRDLVPMPPETGPLPFTPDRHAALAFLTGERPNLVPVVRFASEHGRPAAAWALTYLLTSFFDTTGHWHERVELCRHGAAAAEELGDPVATSEMRRALGVAYFMTRRMTDALHAGELALRAVREIGDLAAEGHVLNNIANAHAELRRFDDAEAAHLLAVRRCAEAGHRLGHALSQRNLGHTYIQMGQAQRALGPLAEALTTFRDLGNARLEAATLDTIGEAHLQCGDLPEALKWLTRANELSQNLGDRWLEQETLLDIGRAHQANGALPEAADHLTRALTICREVGDRHGEARALGLLGAVRLNLNDLPAAKRVLEEALTVRARVPDDYELATLHRTLSAVARQAGHPGPAQEHLSKANKLHQATTPDATATH